MKRIHPSRRITLTFLTLGLLASLLCGCSSESAKAEENAAAKPTVPADKMSESQVQLGDH